MTDAPKMIALRWQPGAAVTSGPLMDHPDYTRYVRQDMTHPIEAAADAVERELADLRAKLAAAVAALELIESITVHSGGEIHGVTALHWQTAFEAAKDEAIAALAQIKGEKADG